MQWHTQKIFSIMERVFKKQKYHLVSNLVTLIIKVHDLSGRYYMPHYDLYIISLII